MALFQGNPVLSEKKFQDSVLDNIFDRENTMTVKGTMNKFGVLFLLMLATAFYSWTEFAEGGDVWPWIIFSVTGGLILALIMSFKKQWSPYLAPAYALLQGLLVGGISAFFEYQANSRYDAYKGGYEGIVVQAVALTFAVVAAMYLLYKFNIIRVTKKFKAIMVTAMVSLLLFYLVCFVLSMSGAALPSFLYQNTAIGIGFSVLVVALAAMNLIINFDRIEQGAEMGVPKYMEWYGAFGLLITIIWLYLEILRLLSRLSSRN